MKHMSDSFLVRSMPYMCNAFVVIFVIACSSCNSASKSELLTDPPIERFEAMIEGVFIQDDVKALSHLINVSNPQPLPKILPYTHQSLWTLAIGHKAEKCIRLLLAIQPFDCECAVYSDLEGIAYLDSKELRIKLLEMLKERIFIKKMVLVDGVPKHYTFLEDYTERKKKDWLQCLGEVRYYEYLDELTNASEKIIKELH